MTDSNTVYSANRTARLAGVLYLVLFPLSIFSFVIVPAMLLEPENASVTARKIMDNEMLFRSGIISHLLSQIMVVFLASTLYRLFKAVSKDYALLMLVLALLGPPISFLNEVHNLAVIQLLSGPEFGVFTPVQLQAQVMLYLDMSRQGIYIAQIFWGLWLLPLGVLIYRSVFLPRWLSIPVVIAGLAYLFDSFMQLLFPGFILISQFTFAAELFLPLWLLIKGVETK
ncbi:MAG: DUF4386 domain-containing protein [Balneolaceae bacterium]|nr:DUF4386 domain-containing protein [Balneolaceae bacterium]